GKPVLPDDTNPLVEILRLSGVARVEEARPLTPSPLHPLTPSAALRVRNRIYERVFDREWVTQHMPDAELRRQRGGFRRGLVGAPTGAGVVLAIKAGLAVGGPDRQQQARNAVAHQRIATMRMALARARAERQRLAAQRLLYAADMSVAHQDSEAAH